MDVNAIRKRYKFMSLKLPLEELAKLSVKDQKQLQDDMRYFERRIYDIAAEKDVSIIKFNITRDRALFIYIHDNKVNMYIFDSAASKFTQYLSEQELIRISRMDSMLIRDLKIFDKDKDKNLYQEVEGHVNIIRALLDKNRMRGSPQKDNNIVSVNKTSIDIDKMSIDDDFDFQL